MLSKSMGPVQFLFSVGDTVYGKATEHSRHVRPRKQLVVARRATERPNGSIEKMYLLSSIDMWFHEMELAFNPPPYEPITDDELKDREAVFATRKPPSWRDAVNPVKPAGEEDVGPDQTTAE